MRLPLTVAGRRRTARRRLILLLWRLVFWLLLGFVTLSLLLVVPLRWLNPPTSSFMLSQPAGHMLQHDWRSLEDISQQLALAVLAAEDQRFPNHGGIDFHEIKQALRDYRRGQPLRGASTISQQVAKNLYLWPQRSLWRKGLETWFTMLIELFWSKRRILEVYLNVAQFGRHVFGAEAASQWFFNRPAATLSADQAALLAAVLPAPGVHRADAPSSALRDRQRHIAEQMRRLGGLSYLNKLE